MQRLRQHGNQIQWERDHEIVQIEPWGYDSLRVRATLNTEIHDGLVSALLPPIQTDANITIDENEATIINGAIAARISSNGLISYTNTAQKRELLAEPRSYTSSRIPARYFKAKQSDLYYLEARFQAYDGERFYGLGQHQHGRLDQKGCVIDLLQRNTEVSVPFLFSSRGYGLLWNNPAIGRVELGNTETRWVAEATPQLDYWITVGETPVAIMEHYADATGHAPAFPEWASGFWQSKLRYRTQDELLAVACEYKQRGLPIAAIIIDYFHWTLQGDWRFDSACWPDPEEMVSKLREMEIEPIVSIWPTVNRLSENFEEMQARGLLLRNELGLPAHLLFWDNRPEGSIPLQYYDATHPEARQFIWEQVRDHYYKYGIKTWWLDACEPEMFPFHPENLHFHLGNGAAVANAYPMLHERGFYENIRAAGEEKVLNLCRSAWAGSQRYGATVWSGDIESTFEALQAQVRAGLNMAMSGIPWWTTDIGGFYGGDNNSPSFRELIVRWFQYGAFCPIFRLHGNRVSGDGGEWTGTGGSNEVWSFGEDAYQIIKELLFLRERLRPYIEQQMQLAHEKGIPLMRPIFFDFPADEMGSKVDDQFMFGPDLLVAPVLNEGARNRQVYLPKGTTWIDAWSDEFYEGGHFIVAEAPLERIPLYLRANARLPIH
jgi:alpha-D-xyloside xylohydrolase